MSLSTILDAVKNDPNNHLVSVTFSLFGLWAFAVISLYVFQLESTHRLEVHEARIQSCVDDGGQFVDQKCYFRSGGHEAGAGEATQ